MQVVGILNALYSSLEKIRKNKIDKASIAGGLLLNNISVNSDLTETGSILEFLVLSFCKAFNISPKVAAGLLAQNCGYLGQVIMKGLKRDFDPVAQWYDLIIKNSEKIKILVLQDSSSLKLLLLCVKPGLISKNLNIALKTSEFLISLHSQIKSLHSIFWSWFSTDCIITCYKLLESSPELLESILTLLFVFGKKNINEVFLVQLKDYCKSSLIYLTCIQKSITIIVKQQTSKYFYNNGLVEI